MKTPVQTTIKSYDKTVSAYIKNTDHIILTEEFRRFLPLVRKDQPILDLGCGPGRDTKIFADKGYSVFGIDLSKKMIEAAASRVRDARFIVMDMRALDFANNTFGGVWAIASFVHVPKKDLKRALREVHRVLVPGGAFLFSIKEGEGEAMTPDNRYDGVLKLWSYFSAEEMGLDLKNAGFRVLDSYKTEVAGSYATNPWIQFICVK